MLHSQAPARLVLRAARPVDAGEELMDSRGPGVLVWFTYACVHAYLSACLSRCMYVCMYSFVCMCMCVCTYVCMYVCMYERMCLCMLVDSSTICLKWPSSVIPSLGWCPGGFGGLLVCLVVSVILVLCHFRGDTYCGGFRNQGESALIAK